MKRVKENGKGKTKITCRHRWDPTRSTKADRHLGKSKIVWQTSGSCWSSIVGRRIRRHRIGPAEPVSSSHCSSTNPAPSRCPGEKKKKTDQPTYLSTSLCLNMIRSVSLTIFIRFFSFFHFIDSNYFRLYNSIGLDYFVWFHWAYWS